jgi:hypothetical protein
MNTPSTERIAYQAWAFAAPLGWDCTTRQIADAIGENIHRVQGVIQSKGWNRRLRSERAAEYHRDMINMQRGFVGEIGGRVARLEGAE